MDKLGRHDCKIATLKGQEWWGKLDQKIKEEGVYLYCQHLSNLQVSGQQPLA